MLYQEFGDRRNPALVCVPGLLGGAEDFRGMIPAWKDHFHVCILDPNIERRDEGLSGLTAEMMREISYDSTSAEVLRVLREQGHSRGYLAGVSLGGKVVYDFASRYPEAFLGGAITDVGPGSFEDSELYRFVDRVVGETRLELPWEDLKRELKCRVADRNLRSLIQSQIAYPERKPPAIWKTGMKGFRAMLRRQGIDDQLETFLAVDPALAARGAYLRVLQASSLSGISAGTLAQMRKMRSIRLFPVHDSGHFLHISHKREVESLVLSMLGPHRDTPDEKSWMAIATHS